jgi:O-ureido-D-serine cyclo-ligase
MKIAIASCQTLVSENCIYEDKLLKAALEQLGAEVYILDWRTIKKDLSHSFDAIAITTTWDLHLYPEEFEQWLLVCESDGKKRLINDKEIIRLGVRKERYLSQLLQKFGAIDSAEGSITPSVFVDRNDKKYRGLSTTEILAQVREENPTLWLNDMVIKPITSADSEHTYRLTSDEALIVKDKEKYCAFDDAEKVLEEILSTECSNGAIIQPFVNGVEKTGEFQLIFICGKFSHAVVKPPGFKEAHLVTQMSLMKQVHQQDLPTGMFDFASRVLAFFAEQYPQHPITRARIDLFCGKYGPVLCEAEIIEPSLNISCLHESEHMMVATRFAQAIYNRIHQFKLINTVTITAHIYGFRTSYKYKISYL